MSELVRDTVFGHFLRLVTRNRVLQYEEEKNPELWQQYIHKEKSANMAVHGQVQAPEGDDEKKQERQPSDSASSSSTAVGEGQQDLRQGKKVDQEKGSDALVVDWWGPTDPEVGVVARASLS